MQTLNEAEFLFKGPRCVAIVTSAFLAPQVRAQEQPSLNASDVADGMRLFQQKGNCQACHGWAGDGHKTDSQMPDGANLRETKLPTGSRDARKADYGPISRVRAARLLTEVHGEFEVENIWLPGVDSNSS